MKLICSNVLWFDSTWICGSTLCSSRARSIHLFPQSFPFSLQQRMSVFLQILLNIITIIGGHSNIAYLLITPAPAQQVCLAPPKEGVTYHGPPFCFKITWLSPLFFSLSPVKCFNTVLSPQSTDALGKRGATWVWNRNAESVGEYRSARVFIQVPPWLVVPLLRKGTAAVIPMSESATEGYSTNVASSF